MRKKKILFFFPGFLSQKAAVRLAILVVSTPLLRAGYDVKIIDSTITLGFQKKVLKKLQDSLCLAISLVTGPMIRETTQIAKLAKATYRNRPVILGAWRPSLLPNQTLAYPMSTW
jgi:anaerobic magnesium-protoporphyrin IX monomethyl ester cyclase